MGSIARAALFGGLLAAAAAAQAPPDDLATRLKQIVDRRIEELRAELHREIDHAVAASRPASPAPPPSPPAPPPKPAPPIGMKLVPASAEFRELFRLPGGCGLRVASVTGDGIAAALELQAGDVVVAVAGRPVSTEADVIGAFAPDQVFALVIRSGETRLVGAGAESRRAAAAPRAETADEVLDRLWNRAVQDAIATGGGPEGAASRPGPRAASVPTEKKPIPAGSGRR